MVRTGRTVRQSLRTPARDARARARKSRAGENSGRSGVQKGRAKGRSLRTAARTDWRTRHMPSYIPRADDAFNAFMTHAYTTINGDLAGYGLVAGDMTAATTAKTAWDASYPAAVTAKADAQAAVALKDTDRAAYEDAMRQVFAKVYAAGIADGSALEGAGMPVRDTTPTDVPTPTTRPILIIDTSQRFRHTVSFADEGTPTKKAKPFGVAGCELRVTIGATPPVDPDDFTFVAIDTNTPYMNEFDGVDGGSMAHWVARWVNTRGAAGPWSDVVSATIPG